jgi:hypothetical protein
MLPRDMYFVSKAFLLVRVMPLIPGRRAEFLTTDESLLGYDTF